jgi:phosphatidylserine decarboxylase
LTSYERKDIETSLHAALDADDRLGDLLELSLRRAADRASSELDASLVKALPWPRTADEYVDYLCEFARWIPQQSGADAWSGQEGQDELSSRLSHFFWIVDQHVEEGGSSVAEGSPQLRDWLTGFAEQWGSFLDTPDSFNDDILETFRRHSPQYHVEESLIDGRPNMPSRWQTFNQFMARELNPGLRPVVSPADNGVIACPADCSYEQGFRIGEDSAIPATRVKDTATYGGIPDLLGDSSYADAFAGGHFVHYMLPPNAYHRFHTPVAGRVAESRVMHGQVYMKVDVSGGRFQSADRTDTGYEFFQTRGAVVLDTRG